jgi:hypothetical protein
LNGYGLSQQIIACFVLRVECFRPLTQYIRILRAKVQFDGKTKPVRKSTEACCSFSLVYLVISI